MNLFHKRTTLYILFVSTIVMIVLMFFQGKPLNNTASIISLELAATQTDVQAVLETWSEASTREVDLIQVAVANTRLDFLFLLAYSLFLFTVVTQLGSYFSSRNLFKLVAYAALLSGILDVVENIGMLQSLRGNISDNVALATAVASYFKWVLVICVITFVLVAFMAKLIQNKKQPGLN